VLPSHPSPHRPRASRKAFTLIELLVVLIIIGILAGLIFTGLQQTRSSARKTSCSSNIRQMGIATANFATYHGHIPASWKGTAPDASGNINGWSAQAQLLPHLEQKVIHESIDFQQSYTLAGNVTTSDGVSVKLSALRVPVLLCPSEIRDEVRISGGAPEHYPLNYGVNLGIWFVYDPATGQGGAGAYYPNSRQQPARFFDGMGQTVNFAEVKAWNPYYRNAAHANDPGMPLPTGVQALGGDFKTNSGHTEWVDGRAHQIGFTTAFTPNTKVLATVNGEVFDVDWTNQQEGKSATVPTYAAVTARSYHGGGVNAVMFDGSVRWFSDDIHPGVWRAFSTRNGRDLIPSTEQAGQ